MPLVTKKESLAQIADSIRNKSGKAEKLEYPADFVSEIEKIDTKKEEKDINFWDYDGTLLYSYTLDEMRALTALPELPAHEELECTGWNFSSGMTDAEKLAVLQSKKVKHYDIGAIYRTADSCIHIVLKYDDGDELYMTPRIVFGSVDYSEAVESQQVINVEWGDGSSENYTPATGFDNISHTYATAGVYEIIVTPGIGISLSIGSSDCAFITDAGGLYTNEAAAAVESITLSNQVTAIENCQNFIKMKTIAISNSVEKITGKAFYKALSLKHINLPANSDISEGSIFAECVSLEHCSPGIGPAAVSIFSFKGMFSGCVSLKTMAGVSYGAEQFNNCNSLRAVYYAGGCDEIGEKAFYNGYNLEQVETSGGGLSIGVSAFDNCSKLKNIDEIADIINGECLYGAANIRKVIFKDTVTAIPANMCRYCSSLAVVKIEGDIDSIGNMAFNQTFHVSEFYLTNVTKVPKLENSYSIQHAKTFSLYVPAGLLDDFKAATNWSGFAYYMKGV